LNRRDPIAAAVERARADAERAFRAMPLLEPDSALTELEYRDAMYEAEQLMLAAARLGRHLGTLATLDGMEQS
jgi:hypothetical protein